MTILNEDSSSEDGITAEALAVERKRRKAEYDAAWYAANKGRRAETAAAWYAENKERHAETNAVWYAENKERRAETNAAWYAENKERKAETSATWCAENPEKRRAMTHRRRARKSHAVPQRWLLSDDVPDGACYWCGVEGAPEYHVEHVMPIWRGGPADESNEVRACAPCNLSKHGKTPLHWIALQFDE